MREIKFRLRVDNKIIGYEKWYSGQTGEITSAKACWLYSKDNKYWSPKYIYHNQKDLFTGLKDKNGKEIYSSDFIRDDIGQKYEIKWIRIEGGFKAVNKDGQYRHFRDIQFMEVIGNIYEIKAEEKQS